MPTQQVRHVSITVTYGDLTVHAAAHVDAYSGEQYSDMANRAVGTLANAFEVLHLTGARMSQEQDAGEA